MTPQARQERAERAYQGILANLGSAFGTGPMPHERVHICILDALLTFAAQEAEQAVARELARKGDK